MQIAPNSTFDDFKTWWRSLPFFNYILFIAAIVTGFLCLFFRVFIFLHLVFNPIVLFYLHSYYSIITFPYVSLDPLAALLSIYSYHRYSTKKERDLGTLRFFIYFSLTNLITCLIFLPFSYLAYKFGLPPDFYFTKLFLSGLWPSIMLEMVQDSSKSPDSMVNFMCFPIKLKNKYLPFAFALFWSLIFGLIIELFAGIITGYICKLHLDLSGLLKWSDLSEERAKNIEEKFIKRLFNYSRYVKSGDLPANVPVLPESGGQSSGFPGIGHRVGGNEGGK